MPKAKCEGCSRVVKFQRCRGKRCFPRWPAGWVRSGTSRYGREFDRAGIAWHCSICHVVKTLAVRHNLTLEEQERVRSAMFQALENEKEQRKCRI